MSPRLGPLVVGTGSNASGGGAAAASHFFTSTERATLTALVDRILPADHDHRRGAQGGIRDRPGRRAQDRLTSRRGL